MNIKVECVVMKIFMLISLIIGAYVENCVKEKQLVLTFDDGPGINTNAIMKILKRNGVTATFFINGINIVRENRWDDIAKLANAGNIIGSHTFSHPALEKLSDFDVNRELSDNELIIRYILNKRPVFFRPPYFSYDDRILKITETYGYMTIGATLESLDWSTMNSDAIYNVFVENLKNTTRSFIALQHEQVIQSVEVLDKIIKYIKSTGYSIVSLSDCLGIEPYRADNTYGPNLEAGIKTKGSLWRRRIHM